MAQQKKFTLAMTLLLIYMASEVNFVPLLIFPSISSGSCLSYVFDYFVYDRFALHMIARLTGILGFLLLVSHYCSATSSEKKGYRVLERWPAVVLLFGMTLLPVLFEVYFIFFPGGPIHHIGFMRLFVLLRSFLLLASLLLWAYGLWRAHAKKALPASVVSLAIIFLPVFPYNNPHVMEEISAQWQQQYGLDNDAMRMEQIDQKDMPPIPEKMKCIDRAGNKDIHTHVKTSSRTVVKIHNCGILMPVLLLAYTWMRFGHPAYKRDEKLTDEETPMPAMNPFGEIP